MCGAAIPPVADGVFNSCCTDGSGDGFSPAAAHAVFVFPSKSHPPGVFLPFSPQELSLLHRGPALAAVSGDLVADSFWELHFVHSLRSPMLWGKISLSFPSQSQAWAQLRMELISTAGGIFLPSSLALPSPPVNVTPLLLIPALISCFQLNSSGAQFISLILFPSVR